VVAVNKMDLADYREDVFERIRSECTDFAAKLEITDLAFVPISALHGDNVVERSDQMPWFRGSTLLSHLELVHIASDHNRIDARFPVQWVVRPRSDAHHDYRGYAGQVAGGVLRRGDQVIVLPSGLETTIAGIETFDGPLEEAYSPMSVTIRLADNLDVGRGDMICRVGNQPTVGQDLDAMVAWMTDRPLTIRSTYVLKHTTRNLRAMVRDIRYRINVNTLHRDEGAKALALNEIGRISLRATAPLAYDEYGRNHTTGSFVLIDEATNATAGAGMLLGG